MANGGYNDDPKLEAYSRRHQVRWSEGSSDLLLGASVTQLGGVAQVMM